jgi:hypothetical protein
MVSAFAGSVTFVAPPTFAGSVAFGSWSTASTTAGASVVAIALALALGCALAGARAGAASSLLRKTTPLAAISATPIVHQDQLGKRLATVLEGGDA